VAFRCRYNTATDPPARPSTSFFPNDAALIRLVTAVLVEMNDEWIAFPRRYLPEGSMTLYPDDPGHDQLTARS
jgi:hypothetical protein